MKLGDTKIGEIRQAVESVTARCKVINEELRPLVFRGLGCTRLQRELDLYLDIPTNNFKTRNPWL